MRAVFGSPAAPIVSTPRMLPFVVICLATILFQGHVRARTDQETREKFYGAVVTASRRNSTGDGSIADIFDRVLENEFSSENDAPEGHDTNSFNNTVTEHQGVVETVAIVTHDKAKNNDTAATNATKSFQLQDVFSLENDDSDGVKLIDQKDNVFVMSNRKSKYPVLQLDLRLISDLVVVIVSAAIGGVFFSLLGQPVIVGYLLAGSLIGPGGLNFISEIVQEILGLSLNLNTASGEIEWHIVPIQLMVGFTSALQVETTAHFGVVFLLFALGLEFSLAKLRIVGPVAVFGGLLQIIVLMTFCGLTAVFCGAKLSEGVFVGSFLSMSSTAVVSKFLGEKGSTNSLHGQVSIGTLILQDCAVGLLFALLAVLGGHSGILEGIISMAKLVFMLSIFIIVGYILSLSFLPRFLRLMVHLSSQTNELYQLASVAFCLLFAWVSDKLGISLELGSFVAGVMISTTDFAQHTLEQVEPIRNLFAALFLASIGMLIHVQFLWNHVDILFASVILVVIFKASIVTGVVKAFGYSFRTSVAVGLSLAQIGEFAFVLLSRASNLHLVEGKMYLLLLGTTALSLITTPLLFKIMPAVLHLGILMRWFPAENLQSSERALMYEIGLAHSCLLAQQVN